MNATFSILERSGEYFFMIILLVEDDKKLGLLIHYKLQKNYYRVDWVQDGESALEYMEMNTTYDLIILDWMIPKKSGIELCQELRDRGFQQPILFLTAKDTVSDRMQGLLKGADDYLVKPFSFEELFVRIYALSRRKDQLYSEKVYTVGDLMVNLFTHEVRRNNVSITLSKREFQLLAFLIEHKGQVMSREQILDHVWGWNKAVTSNAVNATIKLLRKKIDSLFEKKLIKSVRGIGYCIKG
jgi:DNA-binding response OmpR family regulator